MTRINVGVNPEELSNKHLLAEHREMKRIPNMVASGRCDLSNIPENFKLGTGHVKFFYNKLGYLLDRYIAVYNECLNREYEVQDYSGAWDNVPQELMGDYTPTEQDRQIVLERIRERLAV